MLSCSLLSVSLLSGSHSYHLVVVVLQKKRQTNTNPAILKMRRTEKSLVLYSISNDIHPAPDSAANKTWTRILYSVYTGRRITRHFRDIPQRERIDNVLETSFFFFFAFCILNIIIIPKWSFTFPYNHSP